MLASANPTKLTKLLEADEVCQRRSLFCPGYDQCLELAADGGWASFSCERCPVSAWAARRACLLREASAAAGTFGEFPSAATP